MISPPTHMTSVFVISAFISLLTTTAAHVSGEETAAQPLQRQKRHILQMCGLIAGSTNRGCLDYNNYGCYCGLGNTGGRHVDAVDGCCRVHDRCYGEVSCLWLYPQIVSYSLVYTGNEYHCTDSRFFSACAYTTCMCDLEFAQCLGRAQYNHAFSNYDRRNCNRTVRRRRRSKRHGKKEWRALKKQQRKKRMGRHG